MKESTKKPLPTEPYKGVRDFYPEEQALQKYIFSVWRSVAERFGYVEYTASILEPTELYLSKTSEEIVREQTYTFTDRGERSVTLRPEMTPSVARMVAAQYRELTFPVRWYSIPNCFRYERPQRGRVREFWQLNVDLFGAPSIEADIEVVMLAATIMQAFGAKKEEYEIRVNSRHLINSILRDCFLLIPDKAEDLVRLVDRKEKMSRDSFRIALTKILGKRADEFMRILDSNGVEQFVACIPTHLRDTQWMKDVVTLIRRLEKNGVTNVVFDSTLMRGFDYYTGIVFEIFDTNPLNKRSLFGGGRYDDLTSLFGVEPMTGVGFGMGDLPIEEFLATRHLTPPYTASTALMLCTLSTTYIEEAERLATTLRNAGVTVAVNVTERKVSDQIRIASKQKIRSIICIGEKEMASKQYTLKNLETSKERIVSAADIPVLLRTLPSE